MNTCGQCRHFVRFAQENNGLCFLNPPTIFASGHKMRPPVKVEERACGQLAAIPAGEPVAVKEKVNPETPGAAAKDARLARKK